MIKDQSPQENTESWTIQLIKFQILKYEMVVFVAKFKNLYETIEEGLRKSRLSQLSLWTVLQM